MLEKYNRNNIGSIYEKLINSLNANKEVKFENATFDMTNYNELLKSVVETRKIISSVAFYGKQKVEYAQK